MTEKQLIGKYEQERAALLSQQAALDARLSALNGVITALRAMTGEKPKKSRARATGTKAIILDVLADGRPKSALDLAEACKVTASAVRMHLNPLIEAGDVQRVGAGRSSAYAIP